MVVGVTDFAGEEVPADAGAAQGGWVCQGVYVLLDFRPGNYSRGGGGHVYVPLWGGCATLCLEVKEFRANRLDHVLDGSLSLGVCTCPREFRVTGYEDTYQRLNGCRLAPGGFDRIYYCAVVWVYVPCQAQHDGGDDFGFKGVRLKGYLWYRPHTLGKYGVGELLGDFVD